MLVCSVQSSFCDKLCAAMQGMKCMFVLQQRFQCSLNMLESTKEKVLPWFQAGRKCGTYSVVKPVA